MGEHIKEYNFDGREYEMLRYPDTRLFKRADYVLEREMDVAKSIASDMLEIMKDLGGQGLAATQLGINKRIIVMQTSEMDKPAMLANPFTTYESTMSSDECFAEEGCLSMPGEVVNVPRPFLIKVYATNLLDYTGKQTKGLLQGLTARVFLHEVDHLDGKLITDYLSAERDFHFKV